MNGTQVLRLLEGACYSSLMNTDTAPAAHDLVTINGGQARIEYVGSGDYAIAVVTPEGGRFELDRAELTLTTPAVRGGTPAVWTCWTDENGHRA